MNGRILHINVKPETSGEFGLPKFHIRSTVVAFSGLQGDFNRYRHEKKKDDPDMAVLLMPAEVIQQLKEEGWPVRPGDLGENFTIAGIPNQSFSPGKIYRIGEATIEITKPCEPCSNLFTLPYIGREKGPEFIKTLIGRRGWYARVLNKGLVKTGDSLEEVVAFQTRTGPSR